MSFWTPVDLKFGTTQMDVQSGDGFWWQTSQVYVLCIQIM